MASSPPPSPMPHLWRRRAGAAQLAAALWPCGPGGGGTAAPLEGHVGVVLCRQERKEGETRQQRCVHSPVPSPPPPSKGPISPPVSGGLPWQGSAGPPSMTSRVLLTTAEGGRPFCRRSTQSSPLWYPFPPWVGPLAVASALGCSGELPRPMAHPPPLSALMLILIGC